MLNFFTMNPNLKVGGITMHKCTSYGPDMLNLWPSYHLTFKCDLDLQPKHLFYSRMNTVPTLIPPW